MWHSAMHVSADGFCCPTGGDATVRFRRDGERPSALDLIPSELRVAELRRYQEAHPPRRVDRDQPQAQVHRR
jgi:hypothetical protein